MRQWPHYKVLDEGLIKVPQAFTVFLCFLSNPIGNILQILPCQLNTWGQKCIKCLSKLGFMVLARLWQDLLLMESGSFHFVCGWFALQVFLLMLQKPNWNPKPSNWLPTSLEAQEPFPEVYFYGFISKIFGDPKVHHAETEYCFLHDCLRSRVNQCLWGVPVITWPVVTLHWVTISTKNQTKVSVRKVYPGNYCLLPYSKDKGQSTGPGTIPWQIESQSAIKVQVAPLVHPEMPAGIVY